MRRVAIPAIDAYVNRHRNGHVVLLSSLIVTH
jgi:hypothetical protein